VRPDAEAEDSSLTSENVESLRVRIDRRVAVGGGQNDEYRVASLHLFPRDDSILGQKASRILNGRVVPQDLLNHGTKKIGIGADFVVHIGASGSYKVILKRSKSHPLFGTQTVEMPRPEPPPPPQKPTCKLTLAQAPVIRGLRLGMTNDELFAIFPANEREEFDRAQQLKKAELHPNYGYASFQFNPSNYATKDRFTGVGSLTLGLFDRKVVYISSTYSNTPQFDRTGQLMEIIPRQFGLPEFKAWPGYAESWEHWNSPSLSCDGFTFQVSAVVGSLSISLTDPTYKKIADERKKAGLAKKLGEFKW
jgi:hypothetical protein